MKLLPFVAAALVCTAPLAAQEYQANFKAELPAWQKAASEPTLLVSLNEDRLVLENTTPENRFLYSVLDKAPPAPFEVSTRFRIVSAPADRIAALIWQSGTNFFSYHEIQDTGAYSLYEWRNTGWSNHRIREQVAGVVNGDFNTLTVRYLKGRAFYAVNGVTVDYMDIPGPLGRGIGFNLPSRTKIEVDSLTTRPIPADEVEAMHAALTAEADPILKKSGIVPNLSAPLPIPYVEEFDNNDAGWPMKPGAFEIELKDGAYALENLSAEPNKVNWVMKNLAKRIEGDFEISAWIHPFEDNNRSAAGLALDLGDNSARRMFQISKDKFFYYSWDGAKWRPDGATMETALIKKEGSVPNKLTFKAIGGRGHFLINDFALHSIDYKGMETTSLGLALDSTTFARFERLEIKPLTLNPEEIRATTREIEAQVRTSKIAAGPKREEWVENFDDDARGWGIKDTNTSASRYEGGELFYHNKQPKGSGTYYHTRGVSLNQASDFDITLRARVIGGNKDEIVALVFGNGLNGSEHNRFCFSGGADWTVYRRVGETRTNLIEWRNTSFVKKMGEHNELTLRKVADTYFFIINGQPLADVPAFVLGGDQIGFEVGAGVQAAIDQLRVSYPERDYNASLKEKAELLAKLEAASRKKGAGTAYSVALKKEEEARRAAQASVLQNAHNEVDKLNQKFSNKPLARLVASGMRNFVKRDGNTIYFPYKNIGGKEYYIKVICVTPDQNRRTDNDLLVIGVFLQEGPI